MKTSNEAQQDALADVYTAAAYLASLRALAAETEQLLASAMASAVDRGLTKAIVADAAGISRGRVSQIVSSSDVSPLTTAQRARAHTIEEWPADALREHRHAFTGSMTYPPYSGRRVTTH